LSVTGRLAAAASATPVPTADEVEASRAPLMDHLMELRSRLVRILWSLLILFSVGWFVADIALDFLLVPLSDAARRHGREMTEAVYQGPLEILFTKLKLAFLIALAAGFPYIAFQVYGFVAPGLYKKERAAVLPFLFVMPILFVAGAALVYYLVLPQFMDLAFASEFKGAAAQLRYQPKVKEYYDLAIALLTTFGLAFQLPIVLALLAHAGVVTAKGLRKWRKWALIIIFITAAAVTPPDPVSWCILGIPIMGLYEIGIIVAAVIGMRKRKADEAETARVNAALNA
jgi:sec-independent protein translocase protein TatC